MYATNVAMASRTSVTTAELISPRTTCKTVADAITIMIPPAAQATSQGRIRVTPGRMIDEGKPSLVPR